MKRLIVLLFTLALVPITTNAQSGFVVFDPVNVTRTLPGSAYLLSCGPGLKIEVPQTIDGLENSGTWAVTRVMRVTLFRLEGASSMWVEQIHVNRADGARVKSCSAIGFRSLVKNYPWIGPLSPESVFWIDSNTFELVDTSEWMDPKARRLMTEPRHVRFTFVEDGTYLISNGAQ